MRSSLNLRSDRVLLRYKIITRYCDTSEAVFYSSASYHRPGMCWFQLACRSHENGVGKQTVDNLVIQCDNKKVIVDFEGRRNMNRWLWPPRIRVHVLGRKLPLISMISITCRLYDNKFVFITPPSWTLCWSLLFTQRIHVNHAASE